MISVNVVTRLPRHYSANGQVIPESFVQWQGGETMIIRRIGEIAREQGLASGRAEKAELIKAIQRKQGNFDRLATASNGGGDRTGCLWRKDCLAAARVRKDS